MIIGTHLMKIVFATLMACCLFSASAIAQIETSFSVGDGFTTGDTDFTLVDPDDSSFTAVFNAPGEIVFFNNGSLYDSSNRAFAVDGGDTAEISFSSAADVLVSGRDTDGQTTGGSSTTVPGGTTLATAIGSIEAFDIDDNSLGNFNFTEAGFTSESFTGVSRLELSNTGPIGSFAILGSITAQAAAVPEPSSAAVLGLAGLMLLRRKRH